MRKTPVALSYCAIFLRAEMQHIYRQVNGLRRFDSVVLTEHRENADLFPFEKILQIPKPSIGVFARLWKKFRLREPSLVYRGQYDALRSVVDPVDASILHVYFGHTGVHLLPFLERWDRPAVVSFHGMDAMPRPQHKNYEENLRRLFQVVPLILVRSRSLQEVLVRRGCPEEKIRINRTSVPFDHFPFVHRETPATGEWNLLQASRLIEKKGIDLTLRAFAGFVSEHPRAKLVIAGEGPLRESLESLAGELGIAHAVCFRGFCSPAGLFQEMKQAHIFLHPSRVTGGQDQEGVPNAMLEAMATGLPVLATNHGGIPEAVRDGVSGILVPENDPEALLQGLRQFATQPDSTLKMGAAAAESVREEYSPDVQISRLEDCYDEAILLHSRKTLR